MPKKGQDSHSNDSDNGDGYGDGDGGVCDGGGWTKMRMTTKMMTRKKTKRRTSYEIPNQNYF